MSPKLEEGYTSQAVNDLVLITETNLQGRGINADFIYQINQEHPREFLKKITGKPDSHCLGGDETSLHVGIDHMVGYSEYNRPLHVLLFLYKKKTIKQRGNS